MNSTTAQTSTEKFSFTSSIAADVSHPKPNSEAYEWWYFDALSEDGRDAVVIIFLDNFIFSPRYNKSVQNSKKEQQTAVKNFPAVAFTYYRDGKPKYRAINEFPVEEFSSEAEKPSCKIGDNFFRFETASYGSGYVLSISAKLRKNLHLTANFEWLSVESDFLPGKNISVKENAHSWNLAVARADVTGKIQVNGGKGKSSDTIHFRGTGYHDHNFDNRWLPVTVSDWQWGRAHFSDATAVFYRYKEITEEQPTTKIFIVKDEALQEANADYEEKNFARDIFGIRYPKQLKFTTEENAHLSIKQTKTIDSSFFYLRFLSEMTLTLSDGKRRESLGITEYLAPKALKYRWLDWLVNMRIGRNGKGSFL
jgi:carotenoid 1,2-hydratase